MDGSWEITGYKEISSDGLTTLFSVSSGFSTFQKSKGKNEGEIQIQWTAQNENDTASFAFSGKFQQIEKDEILLFSSTDTLHFYLDRQLKKDVSARMNVSSNKTSILILRKK